MLGVYINKKEAHLEIEDIDILIKPIQLAPNESIEMFKEVNINLGPAIKYLIRLLKI